MANPALTRSFKPVLGNGGYQSPNMVDAPSMTLGGTINKAFLMLGIVVVTALVTAFITINAAQTNPDIFNTVMMIAVVSSLAALGLAFWVSLSKTVQVAGMIAYALLEGIVVGVLTLIFESMYPGIAMQAVFATFATAGVMFAAWKFGWIKVTDRFMKFLMIGLFAYLGLSLLNLVGSFIFGWNVYGSQFGWIAGLVGCTLAALSLAADFQIIKMGIDNKAPAEYEWRGAFGLTVTLIWLYLEILRLLGIARR